MRENEDFSFDILTFFTPLLGLYGTEKSVVLRGLSFVIIDEQRTVDLFLMLCCMYLINAGLSIEKTLTNLIKQIA